MLEEAPRHLLQVGPFSDPLVGSLALLLLTLLPPVLFAAYLRNAERHRREPWWNVAKAFLWGGTVAVVIAIVAQLGFEAYAPAMGGFPAQVAFATVVVAPVTEEIAKALGIRFVRDRDPEPEDGYVYGGVLGIGFAATENILYVFSALILQGSDVAFFTAGYRGVVTVALHAAASAIAGAGVWRARHGGGWTPAIVAVILAIVLHAVYNGLVSVAPFLATLLAAGGAVYVFLRIRKRVRALDRPSTVGP